jgi:hypothetical protein
MASGLRLRLHRPTGHLASYVRAFQLLSTDDSARVSVLDFAGADVSVPLRFGDPVVVEDSGPAIVESAAVVGPRTRSTWLRFDGRIDQVNVSFYPGVAAAFTGLPMPEIVGRVVASAEVWPRGFVRRSRSSSRSPSRAAVLVGVSSLRRTLASRRRRRRRGRSRTDPGSPQYVS